MKKSKFETPVINARTRFPGASLNMLADIAGCSKKTVWAVLTARGMYRVGDNWGGARTPYKRKAAKIPEPQPLCTCCRQQPKRSDLRFLCDTCYTSEGEREEAGIYGLISKWARERSDMP